MKSTWCSTLSLNIASIVLSLVLPKICMFCSCLTPNCILVLVLAISEGNS